MRITLEELERRFKAWPKKGRANLRVALKKAAVIIEGEAVKKHLHEKMEPGQTGGFENSTLLSQTGMRHRLSHRLNVTSTRVTMAVGTNLTNRGYSYPRAHEYGLGRMPKRPWLRPSIKKKMPRTIELITEAWVKAYGR